eukprot:m.41565 g.41565  ORF g.41565 m.41565 type:complete len:53 (+) comp10578_c1_seq1:212-370(+)
MFKDMHYQLNQPYMIRYLVSATLPLCNFRISIKLFIIWNIFNFKTKHEMQSN